MGTRFDISGGGRRRAIIAVLVLVAGVVAVASLAQGEIKQRDKLTASDGAAGDQFGTAVAVDGHTLVVSAPHKQIGSNSDQGALYVYNDEETGAWERVARLTAKTGAAGDELGSSTYGSGVAISGNTIVASTFGRTTTGGASEGCAYVFTRKGPLPSGWAKASQHELQTSDAPVNNQCTIGPVAISGDTLALAGKHSIGGGHANGSVYVFKRSNQGDWKQKQRLIVGADNCCNLFGNALAMDGDDLVIGDRTPKTGIAYVYGLRSGKFEKTATLTPPSSETSFGDAVAISGKTVAIGADYYAPTPGVNRGAAYVFTAGGHFLARLTDPKAVESEGGNLGRTVATDGDLVIAGAQFQPARGHTTQDATDFTGMVDAWTKPPGGWDNSSHPIQVYADDAEPSSDMGRSVAMTNKEFFAGSPARKVGNDSLQGATYIFGFLSKVVLKVDDNGSGDGVVKSDPPGIKCPKQCRAAFDPGVNVKLTADPRNGSRFAGWSGSGCSGDKLQCKVAMNVSRTVKAKFVDKHR